MIIRQIGIMHGKGYVHGDLLPRNVLFKGDEGFVIDFDLSRKIGRPYVEGFNHGDFMDFRHKGANRWEPMLEEHDVHSLYQMSKHFFCRAFSRRATCTGRFRKILRGQPRVSYLL